MTRIGAYMSEKYLFSSESVTEGHPDKMCDLISDAILDAYLEQDPNARVACETTTTTGIISIMGEITSTAVVDIKSIVRDTVREIGYTNNQFGFDADNCAVVLNIDMQSSDISMGVSQSMEYKKDMEKLNKADFYELNGAGDQGMMFGYACSETKELMPAPVEYAHKLCKRLSFVRKNKIIDYIGPDGKAMVTFLYEDGKPVTIQTIVISTQHLPDAQDEKLKEDIINYVIKEVIPDELFSKETKILINPTGRFVKGGPSADSGLTGRKIIVDTYGGAGRHGGGAFSGKDPTKVDRSGAYVARYVAKNIVAAGIADKCEVQVAYAIGVAKPVSVYVNSYGTSQYSDSVLSNMVTEVFDLRPSAIMEYFNLKSPIYKQLAAYGHFGRADLQLQWEKVDKVDTIKAYLEKVKQGVA